MSHQAKVIEVKKAANGILSVRARCCGDKSTDKVLSLHQLSRSDDELKADVDAHLAKVEQEHADAIRANDLVERFLNL